MPAMIDPPRTPAIACPAERPLAMLLEPRDHAVALIPAAILNYQSCEVEIGGAGLTNNP